jgi:hypothetical protein
MLRFKYLVMNKKTAKYSYHQGFPEIKCSIWFGFGNIFHNWEIYTLNSRK